MKMEFDAQELDELKGLIERYRECPGDGSYYHHIENFFMNKASECGLLPQDI